MADPMKRLSIPQLLVLSTAAQRLDRMVMPLPEGLRVRGASQRVLLGSLLKLQLVEELHTDVSFFTWRRDEHGQNFALAATTAGLAAVGVVPAIDAPGSEDTTPDIRTATSSESQAGPTAVADTESANGAIPPRGKLGQVLSAVSSAQGATTQELTTLTGWQTHTTRAALTRLRQRGYPLELVKRSDRTAYHLISAAGT